MQPVPYHFDPADPRSPTEEQWAELSPKERAKIVAQLPSEPPRDTMPEGDRHRVPKERAVQALGEFFRRAGRRIYLSAELPVYYPGQRWFAPDLLAVLDEDPHPRDKWVVIEEGKGLDFVLEITLGGDRNKDLTLNVERYARLGIPEYFVLDLVRRRIVGYRLDRDRPGTYAPIVPQAGRWASQALGLELTMEAGKIRFFSGSAALPDADELIDQMSKMVDELIQKEQELSDALDLERSRADTAEENAQRARSEAQIAQTEAQTAREDAAMARQRARELTARLRELGIDVEEIN